MLGYTLLLRSWTRLRLLLELHPSIWDRHSTHARMRRGGRWCVCCSVLSGANDVWGRQCVLIDMIDTRQSACCFPLRELIAITDSVCRFAISPCRWPYVSRML